MDNLPIPIPLSKQEIQRARLKELVAKARAESEKVLIADPTKSLITQQSDLIAQSRHQTLERLQAERDKIIAEEKAKLEEALRVAAENAPKMVWNEDQQAAIDKSKTGVSFNLIGKAGTGKTTVVGEMIRQLIAEGRIPPLQEGTKQLRSGLPGVAIVSFTNRAVKNIAKRVAGDIRQHTITLHKLLEFEPTYFDIQDADGKWKKTMRFVPTRNKLNPLPSTLKLIVFEESSMISVELFRLLLDALPHHCQFIFLGDLQQLPPVYGAAILGFKLLELPTVELKQIYRQAEGSPIIELAWKVSNGETISEEDVIGLKYNVKGKVTIRPWKKKLDSFDALHIMNILFRKLFDEGHYDPNEDMIMIPFNKQLGTIEFNKNLAQHLGRKRKAVVHEIIAGFEKHYYAVGDKILCERQEAIIEEIIHNAEYRGNMPISPSVWLNRWGMYEPESDKKPKDHTEVTKELSDKEVDELLLRAVASEKNEEAKQQASHILRCRMLDSDEIVDVRTTGQYSATDFAYALTVHKCQGSEWKRCYIILHRSHAVMLNRELLYTAITRAREEVVILCEPDTFVKGVLTQRIKGNTLAEKAEFFKGKMEEEKEL